MPTVANAKHPNAAKNQNVANAKCLNARCQPAPTVANVTCQTVANAICLSGAKCQIVVIAEKTAANVQHVPQHVPLRAPVSAALHSKNACQNAKFQNAATARCQSAKNAAKCQSAKTAASFQNAVTARCQSAKTAAKCQSAKTAAKCQIAQCQSARTVANVKCQNVVSAKCQNVASARCQNANPIVVIAQNVLLVQCVRIAKLRFFYS